MLVLSTRLGFHYPIVMLRPVQNDLMGMHGNYILQYGIFNLILISKPPTFLETIYNKIMNSHF